MIWETWEQGYIQGYKNRDIFPISRDPSDLIIGLDKTGTAKDKTGTARNKEGKARYKKGTAGEKQGQPGTKHGQPGIKQGQGHNWTNAQQLFLNMIFPFRSGVTTH